MVGAIDEESKHRNALLEELESTVFKAQAAVKETVRKINKKYKEGGGRCAASEQAEAKQASERALSKPVRTCAATTWCLSFCLRWACCSSATRCSSSEGAPGVARERERPQRKR